MKDAKADDLRPLTSLRFIAAMMIVILHSRLYFDWPWLKAIAWPLDHGVSFFFVLSGFILTHAYTSKPFPGYFGFMRARLARLWPIHIFSLLALVFLVQPDRWALDGPGILNKWVELGLNITLLQSLFPFEVTQFAWNSVSWSISTEMFFYLAFPLLLINIGRTWHWKLMGSVLCVSVVALLLKVAMVPPAGVANQITLTSALYTFPLVRGFEFCMGMATYVLWNRYIRPAKLGALTWNALELFALLVVWRWFSRDYYIVGGHINFTTASILFGQSGSAWLFAILIASVAAGRGVVGKVLSCAPFVFLGQVSFCVYMLHQVLMKWFAWRLPVGLSTPLVFLPTLLTVASVSYLLIESPARHIIVKGWRAPRIRGPLAR